MPLLIYCRKNAQLANRLLVYAQLLAVTRERGWRLYDPTFEDYADHFRGTCGRPHGRSYLSVRLMWQLGKLLVPISRGLVARARARGESRVDLKAAVDAAEASRARVLLVQGFRVRHPPYVVRHAPYLREFFTPIDRHRIPAEQRVAELRADGAVVVGIHIRHGDYATHCGGRFFYEFTRYAGFMQRIRELLPGRSVRFLVCSNAKIDPVPFQGLDWRPGPGDAVADLHALSLCDYILGPPSSFNAWASFHGQTPLYSVEDPSRQFELRDFVLMDCADVSF